MQKRILIPSLAETSLELTLIDNVLPESRIQVLPESRIQTVTVLCVELMQFQQGDDGDETTDEISENKIENIENNININGEIDYNRRNMDQRVKIFHQVAQDVLRPYDRR